MKQRIIDVAAERFFRLGFSRVSIDDLVAQLRTSKSTIYRYFDSKDDLVRAVLLDINRQINSELAAIVDDDGRDFQQKLSAIMQFTGRILSKVGDEFLSDLRRHTPELWEEYRALRRERLENLYGRLLQSGVEQELLRSDMDTEFLLLVYTKLTEIAVEPDVLRHLPLTQTEAYDSLSTLFLEGALTSQGRRQLMKQ